jgi:hypothetical protein
MVRIIMWYGLNNSEEYIIAEENHRHNRLLDGTMDEESGRRIEIKHSQRASNFKEAVYKSRYESIDHRRLSFNNANDV